MTYEILSDDGSDMIPVRASMACGHNETFWWHRLQVVETISFDRAMADYVNRNCVDCDLDAMGGDYGDLD